MRTSLRSCGEAGGNVPRDAWTTLIESSTVTNCWPAGCASISVRPSVGRMIAVSPVTAWERLSLVDICTDSRQLRIAATVASVSGVAATKLPPTQMKTLTRPSRIA
jgi:hypothetical protein